MRWILILWRWTRSLIEVLALSASPMNAMSHTAVMSNEGTEEDISNDFSYLGAYGIGIWGMEVFHGDMIPPFCIVDRIALHLAL
jgi:hypothetical protein